MKNVSKFLSLVFFAAFVFAFANKNNIDNSSVDQRQLDANTISTWFRSNGSFNRDPSTGNAGFLWTTKPVRYVSGLWIGAQVGTDTLIASAAYNYEYLPGYTDNNGDPQGFTDPLYRIYKLTNGVNDNDRINWPNILLGNSDQGAPMDYDSLIGILKPADFGTQTMYYTYTDSYASAHGNQGGSTAPMKADIKQLNFAVNTPGPLKNMVFSQFIIINRSSQTWHNTYFNLWTDDDLGGSSDDLIGCDSSLKMGYTYNSTNNDLIFGSNPPAVSMLLLKGALKYTGNSSDIATYCINHTRVTKTGYKDLGMTGFNSNGSPQNYIQSYRIMSGLKSDGVPVTHPAGYITKLYFTGDPVTNTGWNQTTPGDQRFFLSSGPVDVLPGDTQVVSIAQVIERGSSNLNSITLIKQYANNARYYYNSCYGYDPVSVNENSSPVNNFTLNQNFPNPFNPQTKITYSLPAQSKVQLKVFDIAGKEIALLVDQVQAQGKYEIVFDGSQLSSGIYFYVLNAEVNHSVFRDSKSMILIK